MNALWPYAGCASGAIAPVHRLMPDKYHLEYNGDTRLTGPVADQAALFGLLKRVRDLGVPLLSINQSSRAGRTG